MSRCRRSKASEEKRAASDRRRERPAGFGVRVRQHLEWLKVRNYSERTVVNNENSLRFFVEWCEARGLTRPSEVTKPILERYQRHLYLLKRADGRPQLSFRSQHVRLVRVRGIFQVAREAESSCPRNPASELELPRLAGAPAARRA